MVKNDSEKKLLAEASRAEEVINTRIDAYTNALYGARGLFSAVSTPTRLQWNHYVDGVEIVSRYPEISSLLFAKRVPIEEKDLFIANVRNDTSVQAGGYPNFDIYPDNLKKDYYVLTYVEPPSGKEKRPGFDISSEPNRLEALIRAWQSGKPAATTPVVGAVNKQLTFSIYVPVYKNGKQSANAKDLVGYVAASFPVTEFFDNMFGKGSSFAGLQIGIADNTAKEDVLVYMYTNGRDSIFNNKNSLSSIRNVSIGGRTWALAVQAPVGFGLNSFERSLPMIVLFAGILLILVAVWMFYGLYFKKRMLSIRPVSSANVPVSDLHHIDMFGSMGDIYYKTDMDGLILEVSPAVEKYTGIAAKDLIGLMASDFYPNPAERDSMLKNLKNKGMVNDYSITLLGKNGSHIPVSLSAHIIYGKNDEPLAIEGILRDITERAKKEEMMEERDEDLARINHVLENKEAKRHHE